MSTPAQQSPSSASTPNPGTPNVSDDELAAMAVDKSARGFIDGLMAISHGIGILGRWLGRGLKHTAVLVGAIIVIIALGVCLLAVKGWEWIRADRKNAGLAGLATALLIAVGFIAFGGHGTTVPTGDPPVPPQTAGIGQHEVIDGESWESIAKVNGISPDDLRGANQSLVDQNTEWCKARVVDGKPISASYLAGLLPDGKTARRSSFCQLFNGLAIETLRVGQIVTIPVANSGPALADTVNHEN